MITESLTAKAVQDYVSSLCSSVGWNGQAIAVRFSSEIDLVNHVLSPEPTIMVSHSFLQMGKRETIKEAVNETLCLILAKLFFKKPKVVVGDTEWRYFAFKTGLLKSKSNQEFNALELLVTDW